MGKSKKSLDRFLGVKRKKENEAIVSFGWNKQKAAGFIIGFTIALILLLIFLWKTGVFGE